MVSSQEAVLSGMEVAFKADFSTAKAGEEKEASSTRRVNLNNPILEDLII
jgi:hypothetical protein